MERCFQIGQEIGALHRNIAQEKITAFAEASHDYNPLHLDPDFCVKNTKFRTTIAHGLMAFSNMEQVFTHWLFPSGGMLKSFEAKFINPVYSGDQVTAKGEVSEVTYQKKEILVTCDFTYTNQKGELVAIGKGLGAFCRTEM